MKKTIARLKEACRTNNTQGSYVAVMSTLNLVACIGRNDHSYTPWWLYLGAGLFWPVFAFIANLVSPIPLQRCEHKSADICTRKEK